MRLLGDVIIVVALAFFVNPHCDRSDGQSIDPRRWPPCCFDKDCLAEDGCVKPQMSTTDMGSTTTQSPEMAAKLVGCCVPRNYPVEHRVCTTTFNHVNNSDPQWANPDALTAPATSKDDGYYDVPENVQRPAYPCCVDDNCWLARNETCHRASDGEMGHCMNKNASQVIVKDYGIY